MQVETVVAQMGARRAGVGVVKVTWAAVAARGVEAERTVEQGFLGVG